MPQFVVPQFIDVEDKIIGPITTRQFAMGVVAMLLLVFSYKLADTILFAIEAILIFGVYILVAFVKINGQPFYYFMLSVVRSLVRSSLRVWSRAGSVQPVSKKKAGSKEEEALPVAPRMLLRSQALSELSLLVDTGGKYRSEELFQNNAIAKNQHAKK